GVSATYSRPGNALASQSAVGGYHITASLSATGLLSNYSITNAGHTFTINKDTTSLSYTGAITSRYGQCETITLSAILKDTVRSIPAAGETVNFTIGSQSVSAPTNLSGIATATLLLTQP